MGGEEERGEGAAERGMLASVSEERRGQKTATGYSGLFSWENTERGGVGVSRNIMALHTARSAAQKQIAGFVLSLWQILVLLFYTHLS